MYYHYAYRLNIHSEILLPGAFSIHRPADVKVHISSVGHSINGHTNELVGRLKGIGRCLITDGTSITVEPFEGVSHEMVAPNILGGCMSVILRQRGYLVLHASSVAMGSAAVAFLGSSGWGKSTLAAALHAKNCQVLTDDVMALRLESGSPEVIPSFPQCKLAPEAALALGRDPATLAPLFAHSYKRSYTFENGFQADPLPLKKIYILAKGDEHSIAPMHPREVFAHLVSHTRAASTLFNPQVSQEHFRQCTQLLEQVPCYRFTRKPGLAELPDLVKLVTNHANDDPLEHPLVNPLCDLARN